MADSENTFNGNSNTINPDSVYGLNNNCGGPIGYYHPNTIGDDYFNKYLQEAALFNLNKIYNSNTSVNSNVNGVSENPANFININDNPSLRQADIARQDGGTTSGNYGDYPINDNNFIGTNYAGSSANSNNTDLYYPNLPQTPASTIGKDATLSNSASNVLGIEENPAEFAITPEAIQYLNGFLRTQIGRRITVDFLIGTNNIVTKTGYLLGVARDYILINELDSNDITTCDFFNIKFMKLYY